MRGRSSRVAAALGLFLAASSAGSARAASTPPAAEVDKVFADLDRPDSPGCALAVIREGAVVYQRGYGMANLEHGVLIIPRTVFDIGSTSKQFTAMSVALLAQQGKLSLDDDVRRWVPELPRYPRPITLRHLVHHTSGLRDYLELMDLAGVRSEDWTTDDDALAVLARQKELNFEPGAEWLYSNSGYFLLSLVVKRASGRSLRAFAQESLFDPLGMRDTHFHDDHAMVVKNRATGYSPAAGGGFRIDMSDFEQTGDGAVYTTVLDLALWDRNFYDAKVGGGGLIDLLLTPGRLESGEALKYASGLFVDAYRGLKAVSHGGSWAGYRAELLRFPEQRLSVACLCNLSSARPSRRARQVADLYLAEEFQAAEAATEPKSSRPPVPTRELREKAGTYRDPVSGSLRRVIFREGKLFLEAFGGSYELRLDGTAFRVVGAPVSTEVSFESPGPGIRRMREATAGRPAMVLEAIPPVSTSAAELVEYAGAYFSDELETTYRLVVEDGRLVRRAKNQEPEALSPSVKDEFSLGSTIFRFRRDPAGRVSGFALDRGRIRNVRFERR